MTDSNVRASALTPWPPLSQGGEEGNTTMGLFTFLILGAGSGVRDAAWMVD